ncbi:DUF934 domain-containing protein [Hahella sp. SMD15-11]|uniref:DUF934 domain-containing protein n=1 Tax=Thermohahella caldifontis TaxID=3142973 RepID=A0AB39UYJ0_9GAMM
MPKLIKDRQLIDDVWQILPKTTMPESQQVPQGHVIVPLSTWLAQKAELAARDRSTLGVWLDSDEEPEVLAGDTEAFAVIAVHFPVFADGRGYSIGRLVRERLGFKGELRAFGDIFKDMLFYLKRCGFNAFALADGEDLEDALSALDTFSVCYQGAVDQPLPLFRSRA